MNKFWNQRIQTLKPYVPGEQPKDRRFIKLNTNENPYPPSPKTLEAAKAAADAALRLYPDPDCTALKQCIAQYNGLAAEQVFVGNSSDEVLAMVFLALLGNGGQVLFPDITYSFYPVYCGIFGVDYRLIPLNEDFSIPVDAFLCKNGGILICNPNAPTGKVLSLDSIRTLLEGNPDSVVVVDEAYVDFGAESAVGLVNEYENLLVVQTFSKSRALAGMRIGFALGHRELIAGLETAKNSFNAYPLDRVALAAGNAAIEDVDYFNLTRNQIIATRERTVTELRAMGFQIVESKANFIFVSHPEYAGAQLFKQLREAGILVRYYDLPRINNHLRITIGTDEEMDVLLRTMAELVNTQNSSVAG